MTPVPAGRCGELRGRKDARSAVLRDAHDASRRVPRQPNLRAFRPFRRALLSARGGLSIPFLDPIPPAEGGGVKSLPGRFPTGFCQVLYASCASLRTALRASFLPRNSPQRPAGTGVISRPSRLLAGAGPAAPAGR